MFVVLQNLPLIRQNRYNQNEQLHRVAQGGSDSGLNQFSLGHFRSLLIKVLVLS